MSQASQDSAKKLLASTGLPENFLNSLLVESDWSFVIKLHALFEAVLASLIVKKLGAPALQDVITNLEFNNAKAGKVSFAQALDLLDSREAAFLRGLSELRNRLVHDVRNVQFDLRAYVTNMDANQRKSFKSQFGRAILGLPDGEAEYTRLLREHPSRIIYFAAYSCLLVLEFKVSNQRRNMLIEAVMKHAKR